MIEEMERMVPVLLCKLEKIFPPGFFNPMQHMILHLPYEARMGGPVQGRWCYPIERCQKVLRTKCKNKCKIEASIAEAYILEEVSNFTSKYYADNLPSVHNPLPRYNNAEADYKPQPFPRATRKCKCFIRQDLKCTRVAHCHAICVDQPFRSAAVHTVSSQ